MAGLVACWPALRRARAAVLRLIGRSHHMFDLAPVMIHRVGIRRAKWNEPGK